jgi:hypothetical protein
VPMRRDWTVAEFNVAAPDLERAAALLTQLPALLAQTRAARGHSYRQASRLSGVTPMVLCDMETGQRHAGRVQVDTAVKILRYAAMRGLEAPADG